jgi:hypothetical protein
MHPLSIVVKRVWHKIDVPKSNIATTWTPIFEWWWLGVNLRTEKHV